MPIDRGFYLTRSLILYLVATTSNEWLTNCLQPVDLHNTNRLKLVNRYTLLLKWMSYTSQVNRNYATDLHESGSFLTEIAIPTILNNFLKCRCYN